jgi:hypothetical protein
MQRSGIAWESIPRERRRTDTRCRRETPGGTGLYGASAASRRILHRKMISVITKVIRGINLMVNRAERRIVSVFGGTSVTRHARRW